MITHRSIGYSGRLGNQMFQYATLKALMLRTGFEAFLPMNLEIKQDGVYDYTNRKWISYRLELQEGFDIQIEFKNTIVPNLFNESGFSYDSNILQVQDGTAIEGYFQSYKYFEDYADEIRKDFTFLPIITDTCKSLFPNTSKEVVGIHIRRGDYVAHPGYWNITPEYLQKALDQFSDKNYTFLVFSDDISWCKQVFPNEVHYSEGRSQFEDLCLMSMCDHNIISNSTFSWWGAYLNNNREKQIIAPRDWFLPAKPLDDLYPENWIII